MSQPLLYVEADGTRTLADVTGRQDGKLQVQLRRDGTQLVAECASFDPNPEYLGEGSEDQAPQAGDVVELLADWYGDNVAGTRGVIDSCGYGGDLLMVVLKASAHRPADGSHVSCSGGPCPPVWPNQLVLLGRTTQRFWKWRTTPKAHGGVDYTAEVNHWGWIPEGNTDIAATSCAICGEALAGETAEMHDPATQRGGIVHADCGLGRGWEVS